MKITIATALIVGAVNAQDFGSFNFNSNETGSNSSMTFGNGPFEDIVSFGSNFIEGNLTDMVDSFTNGTMDFSNIPMMPENMTSAMNSTFNSSNWPSNWSTNWTGNYTDFMNMTGADGNPLKDMFGNFTMPPTDVDQWDEWAMNQTWPWDDNWSWPQEYGSNLCAKPAFMDGIFEREGCKCNLTNWDTLQWHVPNNCKVFMGYNDCDKYEVTRDKKLLSCSEHSYCQYSGRPKCVQYHGGKWMWETGATKLAASAAVAVALASMM
eukprot:CAMPEP_0170483938 /NCGR_PEP_ID=MMETSP0208-20121228/3507_1 /TAXON_ID=197538 /ORGANISM="Strombidium inclinatum, Strain S3" /LENGTH=264 /DNA_ID=CAMNT_0010757133 /DNA_START=1 /DNA_END=795 /DNA_ORIENTATION=-